MGYGKKTDPTTGLSFDLDMTYAHIIKPAVENAGYECIRGDEIKESGLIDKSMYGLLIYSDLVIADISTYNPNALYELGVRHAVRPYSTIIMKKEDQGKVPFDLDHNKIFHYKHQGDDIPAGEAIRCQNELKHLILEVQKHQDVDSPLFSHLQHLIPYELSKEDFSGIIRDLAEKSESIFAWTEQAKLEMVQNNFVTAANLWKKAALKSANEPYYVQQQAISAYKSKFPSEQTALLDALQIINQLNPEDHPANDPETLGITGAIYKNMWLIENDITLLDRAIDYYGKGYKMNRDYYTGENYALCLDFKAQMEENPEEQIYYRIEARKTREEIITILKAYEEEEDFKNRNNLKWIYATMAHCLFALNKTEEALPYEELFLSLSDAPWDKETYEKSKQLLHDLKK